LYHKRCRKKTDSPAGIESSNLSQIMTGFLLGIRRKYKPASCVKNLDMSVDPFHRILHDKAHLSFVLALSYQNQCPKKRTFLCEFSFFNSGKEV